MEAILEGELEKGKNTSSSSSKDWRPFLFVLKRTSGLLMLYYYRDTKKRWQKQSPKGVVVLTPWFHVSIAHECSYKFSFTVKHPEGTIYLAAKDDETMNNWLVNIQGQMTLNTKEGDNCYEVEAIQSDDMKKLQAKGNLIIKLSLDEIQLAQGGSLAMIANWPLMSLRQYSSENGTFTIEMGRRSPRGQGTYSFKTIQDSELFYKVQSLINKAATAPQHTLLYRDLSVGNNSLKDDILGASSFGFDIDNRPPAPLPLVTYPPPPLPPKDNALDNVDSGGIRLSYDSITKAELQHRQQTLLAKSSAGQPQDANEELSTYDVTRHGVVEDTGDHLYDVLKHDRGPLAAPAKANLTAYNIVHVKEPPENVSIPQDISPYDLAYPNLKTDSNSQQQPVSNPVYSLGGLSNNPMYGTSADVGEVRQSLEISEHNSSVRVNGQEENNEIENSDEIPPPIPPQNF